MKKLFFTALVAAIVFAVNANAQISVGVGYANETIINKDAVSLVKINAFNMFDLKLAFGLGMTVSEKVDVKFGYNLLA